jgi:hypothetical protein
MKMHKMWRMIQDNGYVWEINFSSKPEHVPENWRVQRVFVLR